MVDYFIGIRRNKVQIHATAWIDLEKFVINENSQTQ